MKCGKVLGQILTIAAFGLVASGCTSDENVADSDRIDGLQFNPQTVIDHEFKAIIEPQTVSADKAALTLDLGELVLGVEINGESRAYPINMLTGPEREIINDKLGGTAIAATW